MTSGTPEKAVPKRATVTLTYSLPVWRELIDGLTAEELSASPNPTMLRVRDDLREQLDPLIGTW